MLAPVYDSCCHDGELFFRPIGESECDFEASEKAEHVAGIEILILDS
jgi:hypothetical protein